MNRNILDKLLAGWRAGLPMALATRLSDGAHLLAWSPSARNETASESGAGVSPAGGQEARPTGSFPPSQTRFWSDGQFTSEVQDAIRAALAADASGVIETANGAVFVEVWNPPLRLLLIGAVHIGQALAPMACLAGYRVTVIDPRSAFASASRFPGVEIVAEWPDEVLPGLKPDRRTAIVTLTHDPKIDDPALLAALRSDAFYIGALGSRKTHGKRCGRLAEAGVPADQIARIHGPVGLAIGALTPAEIAISILAQITAVLHRAGLPA
jgi:xanthine dehydrogenase accessory factor